MIPTHKTSIKTQAPKEEYALVLDVIVQNTSSLNSLETIQALGTTAFTLLELVPKHGVSLKAGDKVYIGDGKRDHIQYIKRSLTVDLLNPDAKSELLFAITHIITENEKQYVDFINKCGPITIRKHALELIPGIGKKHLSALLEERYKPFESFADMTKRCPFFQDPAKAMAQRVIFELEDSEDVKIFVRR